MYLKTLLFSAACLAMLPGVCHGQRDSFSVYFPTGIGTLGEAQEAFIDSLLYAGVIGNATYISIRGYADEPGSAALNNSLATKRAASVRDYMELSGLQAARITSCLGMGNRQRTGNDVHQRRVDILLTLAKPAEIVVTQKPEPPTPVPARKRRSLRDLGSMRPGEMMAIENLQFKTSTSEFEPVSLPVLQELADVLADFPQLRIRLEGHICCGSKEDSSKWLALGYSLSVARARAVKRYLVAQGIASTRLAYQGYGFSRPKIYPERNQDDMYQNRRVEIRVLSNK